MNAAYMYSWSAGMPHCFSTPYLYLYRAIPSSNTALLAYKNSKTTLNTQPTLTSEPKLLPHTDDGYRENKPTAHEVTDGHEVLESCILVKL